MTMIALQNLSLWLSEHALNSVAAGIVIAIFAWALLRFAGRQNSSTRFAVWLAALGAIAFLPFMRSFTSGGASMGPESGATSAIALPASWAMVLFWLWAVIAAIGLLRLAVGLWKLRRVRASATPVDPAGLDPILRRTLEDFRSARTVTLCVSEQQRVPAAIGFFKPLIVFPAWAMRELSVAELNSILIHELAHLRRWDDWTNLLQKTVRALLFFHPAVWWVESKLSLEREMACDDAVLSQTSNAREYAACLVSVAEKSFLHRSLALAQAAVSRMRQTSRRVAQILDAERPGATGIWKPALGVVATFAMICGISQSQAPELVSFRDSRANVPVVAASVTEPGLHPVALSYHAPETSPVRSRKITEHKAVVAHKPAYRPSIPAVADAGLYRTMDANLIQAQAASANSFVPQNHAGRVSRAGKQSSGTGPSGWCGFCK